MKHNSYLYISTLTLLLLAGCQGQPTVIHNELETYSLANSDALAITAEDIEETLTDGLYFAQSNQFSSEDGWKNTASFEVKDGKIVSADFNAVNQDGTNTKKYNSINGTYGMVANGSASSEWHEQVEQLENYLLTHQNFDKLNLFESGQTDSITGVSIKIADYVALFNHAIQQGPIEKGIYQDGHYYAESDAFVQGFKYNLNLTVMNGYIVSVHWDALSEDGTTSKKAKSEDGSYGMLDNGNAQAEWHTQAQEMESYLMQIQDPTLITYTEDNKTDALSSVSIAVNDFVELSIKALASGPLLN
ncbi:MAG: FMN-binding protein [Turicibacter sp.]